MMFCNVSRCWGTVLCGALLAGCSLQAAVPTAATPQPTSGDAIATQVAVAQAVAATLTAAVPVDTSLATNADAAVATPMALAASPTEPLPEAYAPTSGPSLPPDSPTDIPNEPLPEAYAPGGNANNVIGGIVVPGDARITDYSENNNLEVVFKSPLWFHVLAYVPSGNGNDKDGAGIKEVRFQIVGPVAGGENDIVHEQTEQNAAYCVFGNSEPPCDAWDFAAHDNKWPGGAPVQYGENYHVQINIDGADGQSGASWNFNFTIEAP